MPRAKKRKEKPQGAPPSVVPVLQKFLKTYQKHCAQSGTSLCPTIQRDLKNSIDRGQILRKVSGGSVPGVQSKADAPPTRHCPTERHTQLCSLETKGLATLLSPPQTTHLPLFDCQNVFVGGFGSSTLSLPLSGLWPP